MHYIYLLHLWYISCLQSIGLMTFCPDFDAALAGRHGPRWEGSRQVSV